MYIYIYNMDRLIPITHATLPIAYTTYLCLTPWPLHDIVITNNVWAMSYKRGVGGGAYIAQWACNSIAIG